MPVKEVTRRLNHISLVQDSPLLRVSLECLEDKHEDRPAANVVCAQLKELLGLGAYRTPSEYKKECQRLQKEIETSIEEMKGKLEMLQHLVDDKKSVMEANDHTIKAQAATIKTQAATIKAQSAKLGGRFRLHWRRSQNALVKFKGRGYTAVVGSKAYFYQAVSRDVYQFDCETECWDTLPRPPGLIVGSNIVSIYNLFLTLICSNGKLYTYVDGKEGEKWVEKFPPIGRHCFDSSCASTGDKVLVFEGIYTSHGIEGHILDLRTLDWTHFELERTFGLYYRLMFRFVHNGIMYQAAGLDLVGANTCFQSCPVSEVKSSEWTSLCDMPHGCQTPVSFSGHILGLGGSANSFLGTATATPTIKATYRYDIESDSWSKFGEMEVPRCFCLVAVVGNKMIVVGGEDSEEDTSRTDIAIPKH